MRIAALCLVALTCWPTDAKPCVPSFPRRLLTQAEARAAEARCAHGDTMACIVATGAGLYGQAAEVACRAGDARACAVLIEEVDCALVDGELTLACQLVAETCMRTEDCDQALAATHEARLPPLDASIADCLEGFSKAACETACRATDASACALLEETSETATKETLRKGLERDCRRGDARACLSVWALSGAHPCSREQLPKGVLTRGRAAVARACDLGLAEACGVWTGWSE